MTEPISRMLNVYKRLSFQMFLEKFQLEESPLIPKFELGWEM
jgi:hypothetical protein